MLTTSNFQSDGFLNFDWNVLSSCCMVGEKKVLKILVKNNPNPTSTLISCQVVLYVIWKGCDIQVLRILKGTLICPYNITILVQMMQSLPL